MGGFCPDRHGAGGRELSQSRHDHGIVGQCRSGSDTHGGNGYCLDEEQNVLTVEDPVDKGWRRHLRMFEREE